MKESVFLLANHALNSLKGKTAHALIRKSEKYNVLAVIDPDFHGEDTSKILPEKHDAKPIFKSVASAIEIVGQPDTCIVSIAAQGGRLPAPIFQEVKYAMGNGIAIINTLHEKIAEHSELVALAKEKNVKITELRETVSREDLHFWSGKIMKCSTPIISVIGTDCGQGKRTTTTILTEAFREKGVKSEMVYTGQTGQLQGVAKYGFILDTTLNDYIPGELEYNILECIKNESPDVVFIEGQSAPLNPQGPESTVFIVSCNATGIVIQHTPNRKYHMGFEDEQIAIAPLQDTIKAVEAFGTKVVAISINPEGMTQEEISNYKQEIQTMYHIPCFDPIHDPIPDFLTF